MRHIEVRRLARRRRRRRWSHRAQRLCSTRLIRSAAPGACQQAARLPTARQWRLDGPRPPRQITAPCKESGHVIGHRSSLQRRPTHRTAGWRWPTRSPPSRPWQPPVASPRICPLERISGRRVPLPRSGPRRLPGDLRGRRPLLVCGEHGAVLRSIDDSGMLFGE